MVSASVAASMSITGIFSQVLLISFWLITVPKVGMAVQSLLDFLLCMVHLLLGAIYPAMFFWPFILIAVLKLLLFSMFQRRMVSAVYKARCRTDGPYAYADNVLCDDDDDTDDNIVVVVGCSCC